VEELTEIHIGEIAGVYKPLLDLENELQLQPFTAVAVDLLDPEAMQHLLRIHRIHLRSLKQGYFCIGNVRMYRLACQVLVTEDIIPVIIQNHKIRQDKLRMHYLAELYGSPVVHQISRDDGRSLFRAWCNLPSDANHPIPKCRQTLLAKAFRIPINTLRKK